MFRLPKPHRTFYVEQLFMNNPVAKKLFALNVFVCFISLAVSVIILSLITRTDILLLLSDFYKTPFLPDKNTVVLKLSSKTNPLIIYYIAIAISTCFFFIIKKLFHIKKSFFIQIRTLILIFITVLICFQTANHIIYFRQLLNIFANKSIQQKISNNFEKSYAFAQYCKSHLQGSHHCKPITDINLKAQKNMLTYLAVRYYLYPLDIVTHNTYPDFDCAIIFVKNNPESHIPDSFTARPSFDAKSLIAIKEGAIQ